MNIKVAFAALLLFIFSFGTYATTVNLPAGGDLVSAVAAAGDNDTIVLAEGTYSVTDQVLINKPITITGAGMGKTVIRQTVANKRLIIIDNEHAIVEHCKLTGVSANKEINRVGDASNDGNAWGLAVTITTNGGTLRHCHVTGNGTSANHNRCVGVYVIGANGYVSHCRIDNNKVSGGSNNTYGGVRMAAGTMDFCLVTDNLGHQTGGIGVEGAATILNCTFVANGTRNIVGGNLYLDTASAVFTDCVFALGYGTADKSDSSFPEWAGNKNATFNRCSFPTTVSLYQGWIGSPFSADPIFEDTVDYVPRLASPTKDIGHAPLDMSVFACDVLPSSAKVFFGSPLSLTPLVKGAGSGTLTYSWVVTKPDSAVVNLFGANPSFTPDMVGKYTVKLTVDNGTGSTEYTAQDCFLAAYATVSVSSLSELLAAVPLTKDGSVIYCAAGDYNLTDQLTVEHGVRIVGAGRDSTFLRQTALKKRVLLLNNASASIENFTITGGNSGNNLSNTEGLSGLGVYIGSLGGTVTNCAIIGNTNHNNWNHGIGIAMFGNGLVTHCVITNNTRLNGSNQYGGGIYAENGTIDNCLVAFNSINTLGAGVYAHAAVVKIQNCTIAKNNCINGSGGGIYWNSPNSSSVCVNTVIAQNTSSASDTSKGAPDWNSNLKPYLQHTSIPRSTATIDLMGDVLQIDPVFVDAAAGDFHMMASSLTRDVGADYAGMSSTDLDGNPRKSAGTAVDLGCYEYDASSFGASFEGPSRPQGFINVGVQYQGSVSGVADGTPVTYNWTFTSPTGGLSYASSQNITFTPTEYGLWNISMTATDGSKTSEPYEASYMVCPEHIYVVEATPENMARATVPYVSWQTAATNLLEVIRDIALPGSTIHLGEGEIRVNKRVDIDSAIALVGQGWDKTTLRQTAKTTSVLYVNNEDAVVGGMTITGFDATGEIHSRGAVMIETKGGTVEDCRITGNKYANYINQTCGIGITLNGDKAVCRRCIIDRNKGSNGVNNGRGGGVQGIKGLLEDCLVCFNTNKYGGGISIGSGGYTADGFVIRNCTVYGNVGTDTDSGYGQYGVGGIGQYSGDATVQNTIIFGNTSPSQSWATGGYPEWRNNQNNKLTFVNCLLPDGVGVPAGSTGCINGDPLFVDAASGNFHLTPLSPCRNHGSGDYYQIGDKDLDGVVRKYGRQVDIGAYECLGNPALTFIVK